MAQTSIRLPDTLLQALDSEAVETGKKRSQLIIEAIEQYLRFKDAEGIQTGYSADLESRLTDAIARIERLENAAKTTPAHPIASRQSIPLHPNASQGTPPGATHPDAVTIAELRDRFGWEKSNAARKAESAGWQKVGKRGKQTLWVNAAPDVDNVIPPTEAD